VDQVLSQGERKLLALTAEDRPKRATGKDPKSKDGLGECPACRGTGFSGVRAATEILVLDDAARKMVAEGDVKGAYLHAHRAFRTQRLADGVLRLIKGDIRVFQTPTKGMSREDITVRTSFAEFARLFIKAAPQAPAAGKPTASAPGPAKPAADGTTAKKT